MALRASHLSFLSSAPSSTRGGFRLLVVCVRVCDSRLLPCFILFAILPIGVVTALALHFSGMDLGEVSVFIDQAVAFLIDSTRAH